MVASDRTIKGKNVLVTGGAGFIGSHLVDLLILEGVSQLTIVDDFFLGTPANLAAASQQKPDLRILQVDASDGHALRKTFAELKEVDVVFDLAVIPLPTSLVRPQFCFEKSQTQGPMESRRRKETASACLSRGWSKNPGDPKQTSPSCRSTYSTLKSSMH